MKKLFIILSVLIVVVGCSTQTIAIHELSSKELKDKLYSSKKIKCEMAIEGTMKYQTIDDIEKRKLNKAKRDASRCGCNNIYLDFEDYLEAAYEGDNAFFAICTKE